MRLYTKLSTTPKQLTGILLVAGLLLIIAVAVILGRSAAAETLGGKLITVHDRGTIVTFVTSETTLKDALETANIPVEPRDAVEPGLDEPLVATDYQVNIYRARPVTVIDGAVRQKVVTPYQTPAQIVQDSGVSLSPEDRTEMTRSPDLVGDGAGLQVVIDRAAVINLDLYGSVSDVRTQAETVAGLLEEKNISLGESGRVSVSLNAPISEGMALRIWREGKQTITVEEAVPFDTKEIQDADQPTGTRQVQTAGVAGSRNVTYEVTIQNGEEVERTEIASLELKPAETEVVIVGTKPNFIPYTGGGSKTDWLAASNIPAEFWGYADFMVQKESSWNPNAVNRSSGACGLAQALPCSKLGPNWNDPVVALNWMNNYVNGRYGGWQGAYNFWLANRWY